MKYIKVKDLLGIFVLSFIVERFLEVFSALYEWIKKIFRDEIAKKRQRKEEIDKEIEKIKK